MTSLVLLSVAVGWLLGIATMLAIPERRRRPRRPEVYLPRALARDARAREAKRDRIRAEQMWRVR